VLDQTDAPTSPTTAVDDRLASLFPGVAAPSRPWWRRHLGALVAVVVVVAVVVSLVTAGGALGSTGPSYRTATVGSHAVASTITSVATVEPVSQATVAFPIAGTVATVDVALGASVSVGQQLATLDTSDLAVTLHDKQKTLANAQLTLSRALSGQSVGSSSGATGSNGSRNGNVAASTGSTNPVQLTALSSGPSDPAGGIAAAQHAVLEAQQQVDAALGKAQADLATATTVCTAAGVTPPSSGTGGSGGSSGGTGGNGGSATDLTACQNAVATVLADQQAVSDAQHALSDASNHLNGLLDQKAASTSGASGASGATGHTQGNGSSSQTPAQTSSSPSAAQLVAYQQAVDAAAAQVAVAQQALAQATVISPIAGTVVALNLAPGQAVTAGSSTANIVIQGAGGYEASTNLTIDQVRQVSLHQRALVTPDGSDTPLGGQVISIAQLPDSSTATPTYRVFVALDRPDASLHNGDTATLAIVTGQTKSALAVPTSAVTTTGSRHTVQVVAGDTTKTVSVRVGVTGDTWTQVTSGVRAGQQVLLADLGQPLPDSATSSSNGQTNGFPGGGGFARFGGAGGPGLFVRDR
jgi:HlyD family secretion protein